MITQSMRGLCGAIHWLSASLPLDTNPCPVERIRIWAASTEKCSDEEIARELAMIFEAGLARWYMPGMVILTPAGRAHGVRAVAECIA